MCDGGESCSHKHSSEPKEAHLAQTSPRFSIRVFFVNFPHRDPSRPGFVFRETYSCCSVEALNASQPHYTDQCLSVWIQTVDRREDRGVSVANAAAELKQTLFFCLFHWSSLRAERENGGRTGR